MKIKCKLKCLMVALLLLVICGSAFSQTIVTGKISLASTGENLTGAYVLVKGTTVGVITDAEGNYSIRVPQDATELVITFLGYNSEVVKIDGKSIVNVLLVESIEQMKEVVVTAMGMKREKRSLGYAMQEVKTEGFAETRSENVANMLQGKVAGVQIAQSASGTGGSTRIVMRGLNSLSGNNQPLWVIDGVPIDDSSTGSVDQWGGNDAAGAASEINPDDIESISVLKGPNAAALYGSRAQNGAVVINTKKAKQDQPLSVNYNGNFSWDKMVGGYDAQWEYGQGNGGIFDITSKEGWGPKMTGQTIQNWRNYYYGTSDDSYAMTAQKDRIKDFFRHGVNSSHSLSIQGGGKSLASRFSFTQSRNEGISPDNVLTRKYFDTNNNYKYGRLTANLKATYTHQQTENRVALGEYGLMQMFTKMPANIRLSDLKNDLDINDIPMNWSGSSTEYVNPYNYINSKRSSIEKRDRLTGIINASFKLTDWLAVSGKTGMDYWQNHASASGLKNTSGTNPSYSKSDESVNEQNSDIMLNLNKNLGDFALVANVGGAKMNRKNERLVGSSGTLVVYGFNNLSNGSSQTSSEYTSEKEIQSLLGNFQLAYHNFLFLDVSGRNDWSSTLPANNRSYFYPSVSLSGVISDMVKLPEPISFLKVRTSWAQVGNDTDPYRLSQTYYFDKLNGNTIFAYTGSTKVFENLKPEQTKSFEAGYDIRLFGNRIGMDLTYYKSSTINQILAISLPESSGFSYKYINAGKIQSQGLEIMLNTVPVKTENFQWDLNLNWGKNTTKCISLDPTIKRYTLGSMRIGSVVVDEGGKFGDIMSYAFARDTKGNVLVDDNGLPIKTSEYQKVGNMTPKWTGSISNQLKYKGFVLNALIDIRYGGEILSVTDALSTYAGNSARTLSGRDGMVVAGTVQSTGVANAKTITAEQYWHAVGGPYGVGEAFVYNATYAKLREISLGYNLPNSLLAKTQFVKQAKLSLVGRDLLYLKKYTPGTSPEGASTREDWAQAFELNSLPSTRNIGFNISLTF